MAVIYSETRGVALSNPLGGLVPFKREGKIIRNPLGGLSCVPKASMEPVRRVEGTCKW